VLTRIGCVHGLDWIGLDWMGISILFYVSGESTRLSITESCFTYLIFLSGELAANKRFRGQPITDTYCRMSHITCRISPNYRSAPSIAPWRHPSVEEAGLKPGSMPLSLIPSYHCHSHCCHYHYRACKNTFLTEHTVSVFVHTKSVSKRTGLVSAQSRLRRHARR